MFERWLCDRYFEYFPRRIPDTFVVGIALASTQHLVIERARHCAMNPKQAVPRPVQRRRKYHWYSVQDNDDNRIWSVLLILPERRY